MKRLNQLLAVEQSTKKRTEDSFTKVYQDVQKADLSVGMTRNYQPKHENGEQFPAERKLVQLKAKDAIETVHKNLTELFNLTATKDLTNTTAKADIVIDGKTIATGVPAVHLLFLEKKMVDIIGFIKKLPTLSLDEQWTSDVASGLAVTQPVETIKTAKIEENVVVVPPTDKFPAQVVKQTKDVVQGSWKTVKFSGALPAGEVSRLLARAEALQKAIKSARQEANEAEIVRLETSAVLDYIFG